MDLTWWYALIAVYVFWWVVQIARKRYRVWQWRRRVARSQRTRRQG